MWLRRLASLLVQLHVCAIVAASASSSVCHGKISSSSSSSSSSLSMTSASRAMASTSSSSSSSSSSLNVSVLTWNLSELSPSKKDCAFLQGFQDSDVVVCGVQECEDIRPRRTEGRRSKKWRAIQRHYFGPRSGYTCAARHRMGGLQLAVYAKPRAMDLLTQVQTFDVPCGVGNVMANKGAVCMVLHFGGQQTLALVNAHLAADHKKVEDRNDNYKRIMAELVAHVTVVLPNFVPINEVLLCSAFFRVVFFFVVVVRHIGLLFAFFGLIVDHVSAARDGLLLLLLHRRYSSASAVAHPTAVAASHATRG